MGRSGSAMVATAVAALLAAATIAVVRDGDGVRTAGAAPLPQPPDSAAPPGAPPHWLPGEEWVMQHWLPFDEARLRRLLRIDRAALWRHLRDDRRTIAGLAASRGWPEPHRLAAALVRPRLAGVPPALGAELTQRALRLLTQGHLSQHVLFHSLHQDAVPDRARDVFGVANIDEFQRLRRLDISPLQIGRMNGRTRAEIQRDAEQALRERAAAGVKTGEVSGRQARVVLARQLRQLPRWLNESHYNGPPRTDKTGRLLERPRPAWAAPALTADGDEVVMEAYEPALPLALRRGEISVVRWSAEGARPVSHGHAAGANLPYSAYNPAVSGDGRTVAFETSAGNRNFAKRYGDTTVLVARRGRLREVTGSPGRGRARSAYAPAVSLDGHTVAFQAVDADPDAPAEHRTTRVWVRDLGGGAPRAVPRPPAIRGLRAGADAYEPSLSGDGRFVAFSAPAHQPTGRRVTAVYVHDRRTRRTRLVSRAGDADAWGPRLAADGRTVVYVSGGRVAVRDLRSGKGTIVPAAGFALEPAISADGDVVAFSLAPENSLQRAARRRRRPPQRIVVTALSTGTVRAVTSRGYSGQPTLSADGRTVAFTTDAPLPGKPRRALGTAVRRLDDGSTVLARAPSSFAAPPGRHASARLCRLRPPVW